MTTFAQLKQIAEHALGGAPDSRISKGYIVNEAIRFLYDAYPWTWRQRIATLAAVKDSPLVALPADFETLNAIEFPASSTSRVRLVSQQEMLTAMRLNRSLSGLLLVTIEGGDVSNGFAPQLRVYPTPTASSPAFLNAAYIAGFTRFTEDDESTADDAKVAPVPPAFASVLGSLVKAKAISEEIDPANPHWAMATQLIEMLIEKDKRLSPPMISTQYTVQRDMLMRSGSGDEIPDEVHPAIPPEWE